MLQMTVIIILVVFVPVVALMVFAGAISWTQFLDAPAVLGATMLFMVPMITFLPLRIRFDPKYVTVSIGFFGRPFDRKLVRAISLDEREPYKPRLVVEFERRRGMQRLTIGVPDRIQRSALVEFLSRWTSLDPHRVIPFQAALQDQTKPAAGSE